jgi:hypothetical protein
VIVRRLQVDQAVRLLWLKMRPDTPQNYEYMLVEDITGNANSFLYIKPWTQFFDLQGQSVMPLSYGNHVTMRNITLECNNFFDVTESDQYLLSDFTLENLHITTEKEDIPQGFIRNLKLRNITVNGQKRF